ncbi:MAG: hypothetical protein HY586_07470 [Candidatus Omnitrophica bacterium]|nr:hypothetical protein [Candidatus Omnitrophota bacterium]
MNEPGLKRMSFLHPSLLLLFLCLVAPGCTVKTVGDPARPITIKAHVIVDIRGMKETASNIEDYVSGEKEELRIKNEE